MKVIDVINSTMINSQIGPSGTLRRINKYRSSFLDRGYDITIFTPDRYEVKSNEVRTKTVNTKLGIKVRLKIKIKRLVHKSFFLSALYIYRNYMSTKPLKDYYFKLNRKPDAVVFHGYFECYRFLRYNNNPNVKTVVFLHSDGIPFKMDLIYYPKLKGTFVEKWLMGIHENVINNVNKCVFIAKKGQENFLDMNVGFPIDKCFLLINGIDDFSDQEKTEVLKIRKNSNSTFKYNLVCTGTLLHRKGQDLVVEALSRLTEKQRRNIHVTFLGDGPLKSELESMIASHHLEDNVTLMGGVPNTEVYRHLAAANIYILMSINEGLPISIIEAMRCSLPIITADNSGMPEIVRDGYNGLLLKTGNVDKLAEVLANMDWYDWNQLALNSRNRFENELTFDRMRKEYCDMLDSLFV